MWSRHALRVCARIMRQARAAAQALASLCARRKIVQNQHEAGYEDERTSKSTSTARYGQNVATAGQSANAGVRSPHFLHFKRRVIFLVTLAFLWKTGLV
jgi:hypothetical protein